MADYYPLLARALEALPDRSPALRKAVYDRARSALIGQLRSLDPPVAEADIELERQALDTAIERLETDYGVSPATKPVPASAPAPTPAPPAPAAAAESVTPPPVEPVMPPAPAFDPEPQRPKTLPEAGPPPDFVPFVPPTRKPKMEPLAPPPAANAPAPAVPNEDASPSPAPEAANGRQRPRIEVVPPRAKRSRLLRNVFVSAVLAVVIGLIAVAAFFLRDRPANLASGSDTTQNDPAEPQDSKFGDRVGSDRPESQRRATAPTPNVGPQADLTVAQRATLYEENTADPKGAPIATTGRAVWRLQPVNGEQGQTLQSAVQAAVDFPEAGFAMAMTIRKNLDATLPASHTVELAFTSSGSGDNRVVQDIGLLQLKDEESGRGSPISGLPVRVRDNLFLIGLSNLPNDVERNTELLLHKNWLDLATKFKSGQRGVLTFDKGASGNQVLQNAFEQWRE